MMNDLADIPKPDRETNPRFAEELRAAALSYNVAEKPEEWGPLAELSSDAEFGGLTVHPDTAIVQNGKRFVAGRVYVTLHYVAKGELTSIEDSFPARVYFRLDKDGDPKITIDRVEVDTSSFYR